MANDDWRFTVEVKGADEIAGKLVELGDEARKLAEDLRGRRLSVSADGETLFVYSATRGDAERAQAIVEAEFRARGVSSEISRIEHWLDAEERWDDEPPTETWEEEELEEGYAPWEVRAECRSRDEARTLAATLESEGYRPIRQSHYLIVGTASRDDAEALAQRLHGEVEAGGAVVLEAEPSNPFAVFGGLGQ
jgi:hypothetical protein